LEAENALKLLGSEVIETYHYRLQDNLRRQSYSKNSQKRNPLKKYIHENLPQLKKDIYSNNICYRKGKKWERLSQLQIKKEE
jgi:hypothetical protein